METGVWGRWRIALSQSSDFRKTSLCKSLLHHILCKEAAWGPKMWVNKCSVCEEVKAKCYPAIGCCHTQGTTMCHQHTHHTQAQIQKYNGANTEKHISTKTTIWNAHTHRGQLCVPHIQNTCAAIVRCIVASSCSLSVSCRKGLPGRCQLFREKLLFFIFWWRDTGEGNEAETNWRKASSCQQSLYWEGH